MYILNLRVRQNYFINIFDKCQVLHFFTVIQILCTYYILLRLRVNQTADKNCFHDRLDFKVII